MSIPERFKEYYDGRALDYSGARGFTLLKHIDLKDFGGNGFQVADLDGDGRAEFISRQSSLFKGPGQQHFDTADCLTAFDLDARILWQKGAPWALDFEYITHGGAPYLVADLGATGRANVLYKAKGSEVLESLDGATGESRAVIELGAPGLTSLDTFFPVPGEPGLLVARDSAYKASQDMYFFNADLEPVAGPMTARGGGHNSASCRPYAPHGPVLKLDNGEYALINGFAAWDRHGRIAWQAGDEYSPDPMAHPDHINCGDVNGDGRDEVVYCYEAGKQGDWILVLNRDGRLLWKLRPTHPQTTVLARVRKGAPPDIHVGQKFGGFMCLDGNGAILWEHPHTWAYPTLVPANDSLDAVVWQPHRMESVVPFTTDTAGALTGTFQEVLDAGQRLLEIPDILQWAPDMDPAKMPGYWYNRAGDWGVGYGVMACDVDGDGACELLIHDRHDLWIYRLEHIE